MQHTPPGPVLIPHTETHLTTEPDCVDLKKTNANVVHLGQWHWWTDSAKDPQIIQNIWNSQKAIAEYLLLNPMADVFVEGQCETSEKVQSQSVNWNWIKGRSIRKLFPNGMPQWIFYSLYDPKPMPNGLPFDLHLRSLNLLQQQYVIDKIFPNGLPSDLNCLSPLAKQVFRELGASLILHHLGKIKILHRTITHERLTEIDAAIQREFTRGNRDPCSKELKPLLFDQCEKPLINEIKEFLRISGDKDRQIVIVFGKSHNFEKYFDPNRYRYICCE